MRTCTRCGAANDASYRFCGSCGEALGRPCPSCSFLNPAANRFCGACGLPLAAAPVPGSGSAAPPQAPASPPAEAPPAPTVPVLAAAGAAPDERKVATVLFADVVGFTSLSEVTDHETVARTVDAAFRRIGEVVAAHGGRVDKYMGDCVMAVFGVPAAHDDDAERAVAAGLAMREVGGDLAFSIGVNTGEVMVTAVGRDGDLTVIGDAVNVAARLEKEAGPGEVLVGRLTAELAGGHVEFQARSPVMLKGKREPVAVFEAVALKDGRALISGRDADDLPPLVGRDDELAFLRSQWRRVVASGRASFVILAGDAGLGKTRLLDELSERVADDDGLVVRGSYPGYGGMGGPRLAADLIRQFGWSGDNAVDTRVKSVTGELHPSLKAIDPTAMFSEQVWAFRKLIERKAADQPVLLAIDDCHRSTGKMLDLLREIHARIGDIPLLLVLAGRSDPSEWISSFPAATVLRLSALPKDDATALATALAGRCDDIGIDAMVERSGGNPLYLRELAAMVRRQGGVVALPPTLQAILAARLDSLAPLEKAAIQHVAVIGEATTRSEVEALGPDGVGPALGRLVANGLLRQSPDGSYDVLDPLLREVAYETLPRHVRGERHRQVAKACPDNAKRARHLEYAANYLADDDEIKAEAASELAATGIALLDAFRDAEGMRMLRHAIDLGHREPQDLLRMAQNYATLNRGREARDVLALLPEHLEDPSHAAERTHIGAMASAECGEPDLAFAQYDDAARQWKALGNTSKEGWAHANKGVALFGVGQLEEAAASLDIALEKFNAVDDAQGRFGVYQLLHLCRPDDNRIPEMLGEGLQLAEEAGDSSAQIQTLMGLSWFHYLRNRLGGEADIERADHFASRLVAVAREVGATTLELDGLGIRAVLARQAGDVEAALRYIGEGEKLTAPQNTGEEAFFQAVAFMGNLVRPGAPERLAPPEHKPSTSPLVAGASVVIAEALLLAGRPQDALARLTRAWLAPEVHKPDLGTLGQAMGSVVSGWTFLGVGDPHTALQSLDGAVDLARAITWPTGVAAAAALTSLAHHATGDDDAAAAVLVDLPEVGGIAGALVDKARGALGDADAAARVAVAADALRAPGLLL